MATLLDRDEYIEQAHFFRSMADRVENEQSTQDLLLSIREELLSTTKLPMALDFMAAELRHSGVFSTAMKKLSHYFTAFQTFVIAESERETGQFYLNVGLEILHREAKYRAEGASAQGIFFYQFEAISRNRLGYDRGFTAMAEDPIFTEPWSAWIQTVRRQIGLVDFADMIYVRSQYYFDRQQEEDEQAREELRQKILFGEKEGKIALANRRKDPLLLFSALARHLGYPSVPRPKRVDESRDIVPRMQRQLERLETRIKMLEEEQKGGLDITKFYNARLPNQD